MNFEIKLLNKLNWGNALEFNQKQQSSFLYCANYINYFTPFLE